MSDEGFTPLAALPPVVTGEDRLCRRCGSRLVAGLVASPRRACCLNATSEGAGSEDGT